MLTEEVIKNTIEAIEKNSNARAVFGEPIAGGGMVIIPVAKTMFSGGMGSGKIFKDSSRQNDGMGAGFSLKSQPVGYIEIREGKAVFRPVMDSSKLIALLPLILIPAFFFMKRLKK